MLIEPFAQELLHARLVFYDQNTHWGSIREVLSYGISNFSTTSLRLD
jgi:hypothetical protein